MEKYYITWDLEKTLQWWISKNKNKIKNKKFDINQWIRKDLKQIINNSFWNNVVEFIDYDEIYDFFETQNKEDDFILSLEDWIYIDNLDFNFSSTRLYWSRSSILENPKDYKILQRDWKTIENQNNLLLQEYKKSWKDWLVICDDWIFSWDTLKNVIYTIQKLRIKIKEIRIVLNFSWKKFIESEFWKIPIKSLKNPEWCIDWLDERDLFYWTKNWGASFLDWENIQWLPYISSSEIANKKASIPQNFSKNFCENMMWLNKEVWQEMQNFNKEILKISDLWRVKYLKNNYWNINLNDVFELEKNNL